MRARAGSEVAFTLVELLVVIGIVILVLGFLIPALSTNSARSVEAASRSFAAQLENARLLALSERTRTRVLLPSTSADFSNPTTSPTPWPADILRRGYVVTSQKKTEPLWRQRGKWSRLPDGVGVQTVIQPSVSPSPAPMGIDVSGSGVQTYTYNGHYIEFLANGSCSLDPTASPSPAVTISDGIVDSNGNFFPKNRGLLTTVMLDPLSGSVLVK